MKLEFEKETKEKKDQLQVQEKRLFHKEENLDRKIDQLEKRETRIGERERSIDRVEKELKKKEEISERLIAEQRMQLEKLAGISREDADEQNGCEDPKQRRPGRPYLGRPSMGDHR